MLFLDAKGLDTGVLRTLWFKSNSNLECLGATVGNFLPHLMAMTGKKVLKTRKTMLNAFITTKKFHAAYTYKNEAMSSK